MKKGYEDKDKLGLLWKYFGKYNQILQGKGMPVKSQNWKFALKDYTEFLGSVLEQKTTSHFKFNCTKYVSLAQNLTEDQLRISKYGHSPKR